MIEINKIKSPMALSSILLAALLVGCGSDTRSTYSPDVDPIEHDPGAEDITNAIFTSISANCVDYDNSMTASVLDINRNINFEADVLITSTTSECTIASNSIPNHDFNDATAHFATDVAEIPNSLTIAQSPVMAANKTELTQSYYDAIMLNGVVLDILSAGCYKPTDFMADADGNVPIGCNSSSAYLLDPLGTETKFGADVHNAHTQPDGRYHYHGNPKAIFDDNPSGDGSPVIGFAADGFPIYGSYFIDNDQGAIRKALSGYTLKSGSRGATSNTNPGGAYDGMYISDWEFTSAGDLDECNGMTVNGQYGYYVTDSYPWVLKCFSGTPHSSFSKH